MDKPPILVLHGLVAEATAYTRLMSALPRDRRVLALDMPGSGYAERPRSGCSTFKELACCVIEAIKQLQIDRPILFGHSHGGAIAMTAALHNPELVRGLILMAPAHPWALNERGVVRFYLSRTGRLFAHLLPRVPDRLMLFGFRHMPGARRHVTRDDIAPYLHTLRVPGTVEHILRIVESWNADMETLRLDLEERPLALPTLLLWGDRDIVVPASSSQRLAPHLTDWSLVTMPGIGHVPHEEDPDQAGAHSTDWLIHRRL